MKALWKDTVLAESDETLIIEGNHYFPHDSICMEFFQESKTQTVCGWKGLASYYDIVVGGSTNQDSAWYYATPSAASLQIKNHVAFWKGVKILE
jgi:uncharacterized protein (DUF427 family)